MNKLLSLTIGIPTCYGGQSLVDTITSIRRSLGGAYVRIMVTADRTPITKNIAKELQKLDVELTWNETEGSQSKKIKQMVENTTSDLYISTQDDVTFDRHTLTEIINAFTVEQSLTMAAIRIKPLAPQTFFESAMGALVQIIDTVASRWNGSDNHLAASGRCLAFRTKQLKKFRIPPTLINTDMFFYLENKFLKGSFRQLTKAVVFIRCPQTLKDQIAPSSRYLFSKTEMKKYFTQNLDHEYNIPKSLIVMAYFKELMIRPLPSMYYIFIRIYTYLFRQSKKIVSNPVWNIDTSTKAVSS